MGATDDQYGVVRDAIAVSAQEVVDVLGEPSCDAAEGAGLGQVRKLVVVLMVAIDEERGPWVGLKLCDEGLVCV